MFFRHCFGLRLDVRGDGHRRVVEPGRTRPRTPSRPAPPPASSRCRARSVEPELIMPSAHCATSSTILPMCRLLLHQPVRVGGASASGNVAWTTGVTARRRRAAATPALRARAAIAPFSADAARPQRRAGDGEPAAHHLHQVDLDLRRLAGTRSAPGGRRRPAASRLRGDVVAADHVEDHVDAAAVGGLAAAPRPSRRAW